MHWWHVTVKTFFANGKCKSFENTPHHSFFARFWLLEFLKALKHLCIVGITVRSLFEQKVKIVSNLHSRKLIPQVVFSNPGLIYSGFKCVLTLILYLKYLNYFQAVRACNLYLDVKVNGEIGP